MKICLFSNEKTTVWKFFAKVHLKYEMLASMSHIVTACKGVGIQERPSSKLGVVGSIPAGARGILNMNT